MGHFHRIIRSVLVGQSHENNWLVISVVITMRHSHRINRSVLVGQFHENNWSVISVVITMCQSHEINWSVLVGKSYRINWSVVEWSLQRTVSQDQVIGCSEKIIMEQSHEIGWSADMRKNIMGRSHEIDRLQWCGECNANILMDLISAAIELLVDAHNLKRMLLT